MENIKASFKRGLFFYTYQGNVLCIPVLRSMKYQNRQSIKMWAEDDRPREKMLNKGHHVLSNAELLAILIGSGTREESALDLARNVLHHASDSLAELGRLDKTRLTSIRGVGQARAMVIIAALELGRRRASTPSTEKTQIKSSNMAFEIMNQHLSDEPYEQFWILLLDRANKVIRPVMISNGGISGTVADPKKIFSTALRDHASGMILFHNHPSGNVQPSDADRKLTKKLIGIGDLMEIPVLDHIIIGKEKYLSFLDHGLM